jgi:hypothetical protein
VDDLAMPFNSIDFREAPKTDKDREVFKGQILTKEGEELKLLAPFVLPKKLATSMMSEGFGQSKAIATINEDGSLEPTGMFIRVISTKASEASVARKLAKELEQEKDAEALKTRIANEEAKLDELLNEANSTEEAKEAN